MVANVALSALNLLALQAGTWDLRSMWGSMSIIAKAVVFILFILSAWSLGVMIDRALMYSAARKQSLGIQEFPRAERSNLFEGTFNEASDLSHDRAQPSLWKVWPGRAVRAE